jgi:(1->4)-alpha-D-glucan 1-alpha-D-glucosylmutase
MTIRIAILQEIKENISQDIEQLIKELIANKENGQIKLFLIYQLLKARKEHSIVFQNGDYQPIEVTGKYQNNIIAFARNYGDKTLVAIAPRFLTSIIKPGQLPLGLEVWEDTSLNLSNKNWHNLINNQKIAGENLAVAEILQNFPVSLLVG